MHTHSLERWHHAHVFLGEKHDRHERRTWFVVALTAATMVAEVTGGTLFGSMAVVADGVHMSTHVAALAIAALAYRFARRHAADARFSFGTGKLGELAAFASALILLLIALIIAYESMTRFFNPVAIRYTEAIAVAWIGLTVNLISAWLLSDEDHHHSHAHDNDDDDHHHSHDHNIRAAYIHVLADAVTSVLAIGGLLMGRFYGLAWMDALVGIVGAGVIISWGLGLMRSSGAVLLDVVPSRGLADRVRGRLEVGGDRVADLHLWRLGPGHAGVIASVVTEHPQPPENYKSRLAGIGGLSHVTIEVHPCPDHAPAS
ncbi:MAG: CDF family Co(II)/Ni(II) efflux transporter DmeF [Hyphomicrobiales bacterium]|nr:CDF family Co(II)/Ni(II) efflux transporter DmeF [Hyphomicrobiales bacterium]MBV8826790.1 CDF family Co(II)/Ni(II) efflux transporter DmeF [Hyphomicrobiales bacterium]MBV9428451.1 CDF family Co(II)/Ni(II) efflux transporter DmeF [Bradyrhizobiaceae bacterium]